MTDTAPPGDDATLDPRADAATKGAVLAAAERLFAVRGFQNVSVRDITAEAGVNLASVNYHFGVALGLSKPITVSAAEAAEALARASVSASKMLARAMPSLDPKGCRPTIDARASHLP